MRTLYRVRNDMPDLRVDYSERFANNSDSWRKFITGCHVLRDKDLEAWIMMVLSKKEKQPDSFKRKINSLDYVPEAGLFQRIMDGEPSLKKPDTGDAKSSARPQDPPH